MASKSIDHHRCYTYVLYKISLDIYIYTVTPSQKKGIEKPWLFLSNHFESCPPSILLGFRRSSVSWTILGTSRCCQMREAASDSMVGFPKLYICMKWTLWTFTIQEIWLWLKTWRQLRSASMSTAQSQRWRLDSKKSTPGDGLLILLMKNIQFKKNLEIFQNHFFWCLFWVSKINDSQFKLKETVSTFWCIRSTFDCVFIGDFLHLTVSGSNISKSQGHQCSTVSQSDAELQRLCVWNANGSELSLFDNQPHSNFKKKTGIT